MNPTLTLTRGLRYAFNIATSSNPFWIKTVRGTTNANAFTSGVTNNGASSSVLMFDVPANAPSTLYYSCQNHPMMGGTLNIVDCKLFVTVA
jgi:hypothetical protein